MSFLAQCLQTVKSSTREEDRIEVSQNTSLLNMAYFTEHDPPGRK